MTAADKYQEIATTYKFDGTVGTSGDITVPADDMLTIWVYSTGLSGAGTVRLVFNADTGSNYWCSFNTVATAGTTMTNTANATAAAMIFTPSQTTAFSAMFQVTNLVTVSKSIVGRIYYETANATTTGVVGLVGGEYVNTTAKIGTVRMQASANNFNAGSGFMVFAGNGL